MSYNIGFPGFLLLGALGGLGFPELLVLFMVALFVGGMALWIWMLVDCATKEADTGNNKVVWILVIALTHFIGALIYLFVRRPQRIAELGR
ncbi:MAG: PLD nuclease N-terminal domain-containing protein [Bryobacteraceae bacterium]|jgi:hypothetical protein